MASDLRLITVSAAADILGISAQRIYAMVRNGVLPPGVVCHFGRVVRLEVNSLRAYIAKGGQTLGETQTKMRVQ